MYHTCQDGPRLLICRYMPSHHKRYGPNCLSVQVCTRSPDLTGCLQGATGDHMGFRQNTVSFMRQHREDFQPYMEDEEDFDRYCSRMAQVWSIPVMQADPGCKMRTAGDCSPGGAAAVVILKIYTEDAHGRAGVLPHTSFPSRCEVAEV